MSDRSRSRSPEPAAAPAPAADASNGDAPAVQTASSETTGEEVKLYLGNLSYDTDEARIQEKFREAGTVNEVFLPIDRQTQRVRGFGFCTMANRSDAEKAIQMFDGSDLDGRMIKVNESKPKGQGGPGGQGSFNSSGAAEVKLYVGNLSFETTKESLEEVSSCCLFLALVVCFSLFLCFPCALFFPLLFLSFFFTLTNKKTQKQKHLCTKHSISNSMELLLTRSSPPTVRPAKLVASAL